MKYNEINISTVNQYADAETYQFWFEPFRVHLNMTIHEKTGYIKIDSCYGQYQYSWPSFKNRGNVSLKRFLFQRVANKYAFDYVMGKFSYGRQKEFEQFKAEETIKEFKNNILERRKSEDINRDEARELWDELDGLEECGSIDSFLSQFLNEENLPKHFCEPWEWCITGYNNHQILMKDIILPKIAEWVRKNIDLDLNCEEAKSSNNKT